MKDKKLLYILIPLVAVIWGIVVYRIIDFSGGDEDQLEPINITTVQADEENSRSYPLNLDYADPFLKRRARTISATSTSSSDQNKRVVAKEEPKFELDWSNVSYKGVIQHSKKKTKVGLLEINGEGHLVESGNNINNYQILSIRKDSIQIRLDKYETWIRLEE